MQLGSVHKIRLSDSALFGLPPPLPALPVYQHDQKGFKAPKFLFLTDFSFRFAVFYSHF